MIYYNILKRLVSPIVLLMVFGVNSQAMSDTKLSHVTDTLKVGDRAPQISVRKWLKRGPVTTFRPGMVYVVEFWATWCGPCQAAMPHLSSLSEKYSGRAEVLSINVMEDKKTDFFPKVEGFVKRAGNTMNYAVAVDTIGEIMEKRWLKAAGSQGIPEVFIVDKQGKIAWRGHPNFMDEVLESVVNDSYDEAGIKRVEALIQHKQERYDLLNQEMMDTWKKKKDYPSALLAVDSILPIFPGLRIFFERNKYEILSHIDSVKARRYGEELMSKGSPRDLTSMAYIILLMESDDTYTPDYDFALLLATDAVSKSNGRDTFGISTLAKANYKTGNRKMAVHHQKRLIQLINSNPEHTVKMLEAEEKTLRRYQSPKRADLTDL